MAFAHAGKKTALIEQAHIGGTCVNEGCVSGFKNMFNFIFSLQAVFTDR